MHAHDHSSWQHSHHFSHPHMHHNERRTLYVTCLTLGMMVVEIIAGLWFHSMALLADGWHMATHAAALGMATFAYYVARKEAHNPRYSFGTGKLNALGGFSSAVFLTAVALLVLIESIISLLSPQTIHFNEAIIVALIGLLVNIISAWMLGRNHTHDSHGHAHHAHDHNLRAAYLHVLADALTSVLAIIALILGKYAGWNWMDPLMGIIGSLVIVYWARSLIHHTSVILLDQVPDSSIAEAIKQKIESEGDSTVSDLHLWYIAPGKLALILSIVAHKAESPDYYKARLKDLHLAHITIEVNTCHLAS